MIVGMIDAYSIYHTITNRLFKILLHMTYFASNRQKKCRRFPFTGFLHPDVNGLDTRV